MPLIIFITFVGYRHYFTAQVSEHLERFYCFIHSTVGNQTAVDIILEERETFNSRLRGLGLCASDQKVAGSNPVLT